MADGVITKHPHGKRRYQNVAEGITMAQHFLRSGLSIAEFARQNDVTHRMVKYWSTRARQLMAASEAAAAPRVEPRLLEHVAAVSDEGKISLEHPTSPRQMEPSIAPPDSHATIEVRLMCGHRLAIHPGFSAALLKQVIQVLEGHGSC